MDNKKLKTQEERSRDTINRLVEATLDCLQEYGYHGVSLNKIIEKAGLTKGAWSHHFKSKKELISVAANTMLEDAIENGKNALHILNDVDDEERLFYVLDYFWNNFEQGKRRDVWVEIYIASRTDEELKTLLTPVIQNFHDSLNEVWRNFFILTDDSNAEIETMMNLTLFVTRGMAIQSIFKDDPEYYSSFRKQWVKIFKPMVRVKL